MSTRNVRWVWLTFVLVLFASCRSISTPNTTSSDSTQPEEWKTYKADSGFEIQYPLDTYSIRGASRPSMKSSDIIYPGAQVLEPNDAFFYHNLGKQLYKVTIAVVPDTQNGVLGSNEAQRLADNPIVPYNPDSLAGHPLQEVTVAGEKAIRVDNVTEGPLHIRSEIMAPHNNSLYYVFVEPFEPSPNQASTYVAPTENAEAQALAEKILATFKFAD